MSIGGLISISFSLVDDGRLTPLIVESGIPIEKAGVRNSWLLSMSTDASAPVNVLKCFVAIRKTAW